ncbi:hypothetical protein K7X08_017208 [Anisodus acutangulus]|uniref:Uncharacterized protein n=1 Tax=Anisodus acutangulus TaxID=402998 RepID=A0A9Q1LQU9_9SOLA|nr:hypothetical protein K7X08_017208 [Anisodus acutangulus]
MEEGEVPWTEMRVGKDQGENTLETLSNWYEDGELGGKYDNGDKTGDRGQILANEGVRRKSTSRFSDADGSETRNKGNNEKLYGGDSENALGRESRRLERKDRPQKRVMYFWIALKIQMETRSVITRKVTIEKLTVMMIMSSDRSRTPERSARRRYDSESVETEYKKRGTFRRKEQEKDGVRDDKSKGRDDGRSDRDRFRDGSKDGWKSRQGNFVDKEIREGETAYEHGREWEIPRCGWIDNERPRSGEIQTRPFDHGWEEAISSAARTTEVNQSSDAKSLPDDENYAFPREGTGRNMNWSGQSGQDLRDTSGDGSYRDETESRAQKEDASVRAALGQTFSSGTEPPYGNQEPSSFNRAVPIGSKGGRVGRGGRGMPTGRDGHQFGPPMTMMGSPFGPLGMPSPGSVQSLALNMSPAPGPSMSPGVFIPPFRLLWFGPEPEWEEYVHRAPGVTDHIAYWTFEEIMNLKIEAIADTSFVFLWVGDGVGLEQGRQCLKKWGFCRCEDICWVKTNKTNATPGLRHDSHTLFQRSKEHCLLGIKGTVRRSTDGHIIHANIDTDVIIAEEPFSFLTSMYGFYVCSVQIRNVSHEI